MEQINENCNEMFINDFDSDIFEPNMEPRETKKQDTNKPKEEVVYVNKRRLKTREKIKQKKKEQSYQNKINTMNMTKEEKDVYYDNLRAQKKQLKLAVLSAMNSPFIIVFDFDYHLYMQSDEFKSLFLQISMCYGLNKTNKTKINYYLTNYKDSIKEGLERMGAKYWHCHQHSEPFFKISELTSLNKEFVYLSPDSPNELTEVSDDKIYVIGGLVDKPIIKNRSLLRCSQIEEERKGTIKITSARLPLGKYIENLRCPALNVNTVAEIISYKRDGDNWDKAIEKALPNRMLRK